MDFRLDYKDTEFHASDPSYAVIRFRTADVGEDRDPLWEGHGWIADKWSAVYRTWVRLLQGSEDYPRVFCSALQCSNYPRRSRDLRSFSRWDN